MTAAARRARRRRPGGGTALKLTSMMDILVVLLLFLLKSFVVDAELVRPAAGVELPASSSRDPAAESVVVAVSAERVLLNGVEVARTPEVAASPAGEIPALAAALDRAVAQRARNGRPVDEVREATLQGDRDIPYAVLEKVMVTLQAHGYERIALAVLQDS